MLKKYQITLAAELQSLALFRDFVAGICRQHGVPDDASHDLQLSVDEACTNVIQHGYKGMNPGSIILELEAAPEEITLHITDFGHAFEPSSAPAPDVSAPLEERPEGGFGLFFIYSTMDSVDYRTGAPGNTLTLRKRLP